MKFGELMDFHLQKHGSTAAAFADKHHIGRAYVYRVRNHQQEPSKELARRLDEEFGTTAFSALREERVRAQVQTDARVDLDQVAALRGVLHAHRHLDDVMGSAAVRPAAMSQVKFITRLVKAARGPGRDDLVNLAAASAIFSGWVNTATHQWRSAESTLLRAWEWAAEAADPTLESIALTFRAYLALNQGRADLALGRAQAASRISGAHPAQQTYTLLQRARIFAELGEHELARPLLDQADTAIETAAAEGSPPEAIYWNIPPFFRLHLGGTLMLLDRAGDAAAYLESGLAALPDAQAGAQWAQKYRTNLDAALEAR